MKIFTFASLLEHNLLNLQETVDCGSGRTVYFNSRPIQDAPGHAMGEVASCMAFYYSSNVGTARLAEKIDNATYYSQLSRFGFGRKTGIDVPGEDNGILYPVRRWSLLSKTSLAIGYEISATSPQVVRAVSAIANNGCMMKPYIVRKVIDPRGETVLENKPEVIARVVRPSVTEQMLELMEGVVRYGTGTKAQIPGYRVGGKTGTARKVPYDKREYVASFVGVLPINAPRICIYVWVDNPRRHHYGGDVAAPVFKEVAETALKTLRIPPTEEIIPETTPVPAKLLAEKTDMEDRASARLTASTPDTGVMPDLSRMTMRQAFKELAKYDIRPQFIGSGMVIDQSPQPGKPIKDETRCLLIFGDPQGKEVASGEL
jgi:cell division protein FtsI (penicillin-binding protein 3)